jgi:hypothetical protein
MDSRESHVRQRNRTLVSVHGDSTRSMIDIFDDDCSRSTRNTRRRALEDRRRVTRESGSYRLTSTDESISDTYETPERAFDGSSMGAPCLRDLDPEGSDLPVSELADAERVVSKVGSVSLEGLRARRPLVRGSPFPTGRGSIEGTGAITASDIPVVGSGPRGPRRSWVR